MFSDLQWIIAKTRNPSSASSVVIIPIYLHPSCNEWHISIYICSVHPISLSIKHNIKIHGMICALILRTKNVGTVSLSWWYLSCRFKFYIMFSVFPPNTNFLNFSTALSAELSSIFVGLFNSFLCTISFWISLVYFIFVLLHNMMINWMCANISTH